MSVPIVLAGLSSLVFVWSLFQIDTPVRGIVFDFDVIENAHKGFVGIHKVLFNNSESIPLTCVHVLAQGRSKAEILTRVAVPAPFEQDFKLDKFGFCKPFEISSSLVFVRFVCVILLFVFLVIELSHREHEAIKKIHVLPMRRSDPNMKLTSVSSETNVSENTKEV